MPRITDKDKITNLHHEVSLEEKEEMEAEEKLTPEEKKRQDHHWTLLYIIIAILVFGLGLLVIALMNLGYDGYMHL